MTQSHGLIDEHARRLRVLETQGTDILTPSLSPLYLLCLRGFWPMSSVNGAGNVIDLSGQTRTLTNNNTVAFASSMLDVYASFNGTTQYLDRNDADLNFKNSFTIAGWFYNDTAFATSGEDVCISKWNGTGNNRDYRLLRGANDFLQFEISVDGTALNAETVTHTTATPVATWYFAAGRFTTGTSLDVWLNDEYVTLASATSGTLGGTANFMIGASDNVSSYLDGRASLVWACDAALNDTQIIAIYRNSRALFGV